jgi:hypothetical protein
MMPIPLLSVVATAVVTIALAHVSFAGEILQVEANRVAEIRVVSDKPYENSFVDLELDAVVAAPDGTRLQVPAFWAGGDAWVVRYASNVTGTHAWTLECSDTGNPRLHGVKGTIDVVPGRDDNPLFRHGPIRVADDHRHFEHADGTPFFWLADTWWKNLCKRMTWEGFHELAADRKAKGFTAIQIVCGPYPDEAMLEPRWETEHAIVPLTRLRFLPQKAQSRKRWGPHRPRKPNRVSHTDRTAQKAQSRKRWGPRPRNPALAPRRYTDSRPPPEIRRRRTRIAPTARPIAHSPVGSGTAATAPAAPGGGL